MWEDNVLMSVNFPIPRSGQTPEIRVRPQGHYDMEEQDIIYCSDPRGKPYYWIGAQQEYEGTDETIDAGALRAGHITVTPLSLNLTHTPTLKMLESMFP